MCAKDVDDKELQAIQEGKNKALKLALDKIEKDFGKGSIMRLGDKANVDCECIPTGALALDLALGIGGVPRGRIIEIYVQNLSLSDSHLKHLAEFLNLTGESVFVFRNGDPDYDEIQQHLTAIARASASKGAAYEFYIASGIYAVLAVLHRKKLLSSAQELVNPELLKKILPVFQYIDENYSEHLSLEDLARCVNFHKAYFCRLFKQATGITVVDYLNFVRIREAEALLRSNMSAIEASYLVGFSSPSYFTKIFKKYRLCSPSTYKKIYSRADKVFADRVIGQ